MDRITKSFDPNRGRRRMISAIYVRKSGHFKRDCPENKKGNAESKEGQSKSANIVQEDSENSDGDMLSVSSSQDHMADSWILDSACSYHMMPNKDWFHTYRSVDSDSVLMGNDASYKVTGIGDIKIKMYDGM